MEKVYAYIIDEKIIIESEDYETIHTMAGFSNTDKAYEMIDNLKGMYNVIEIFS